MANKLNADAIAKTDLHPPGNIENKAEAGGGVSNVSNNEISKFKIGANRRRAAARARAAESEESSGDETTVVKVPRIKKKNPMVQSSKKTAVPSTKEGSSSDGDDDEGPSVSFTANKSVARMGPVDMGATATYELDTAMDRDARAVYERSLLINKELKETTSDDKVYRGMNNYVKFIEPRDTAQGNAAGNMVRKGPIRAPSNLRSTVRWDYQPDICKDYKETGFCGFGDSCKFMHDRTDYKHGWQLEREMESGTYGEEDTTRYEIDDEEDKLPFRCFICRQSFKNPVVTKCGHYFCEACALLHYKKSKRCFVCSAATTGVFNPAKDLIAKIARSKESAKGSSAGVADDEED